jgi:hypothetical protein
MFCNLPKDRGSKAKQNYLNLFPTSHFFTVIRVSNVYKNLCMVYIRDKKNNNVFTKQYAFDFYNQPMFSCIYIDEFNSKSDDYERI